MGISRTYTIACAILCACTSGNQSAHTYTNDTDRTLVDNSNFEIEYDVIRMNTVINGTDTINAIFDTGALVHYYMDAVNFEKLFPNHQKITNINGITISEGDSISILGYNYLGKTIMNAGTNLSLFGPRYEVDYRMWKFDMENRILSITDSIDESQYPLKFNIYFDTRGKDRIVPFVNIPIIFSNGNDSVRTDCCYMVDTGTPFSFCITDPTQEFIDFAIMADGLQEIDRWMSEKRGDKKILFASDYTIDGTECRQNGMKVVIYTGVRSMRAEFKDVEKGNGGKRVVGTIGMQFLKNFNFVIDLKNERLLLKPVQTNYPSKPIIKYDFRADKENRVYMMNINGYSINNGVSLNDSVISANGKAWVDYSKKEKDSLLVVAKDVEWVFEK